MMARRVTLFAGHYGSGKTNVAVNYAFALAEGGLAVTVADLDIVNPYFRTKDSEADFRERGIRFIASPYANTNVDVPALPSELYAVTEDKSRHAILDIGGDERGALALGRFAPAILEENDFEMVLVVNRFRPLTQTADEVKEVMDEIEAACKIPFTAFIDNSNLGEQTTASDILAGEAFREEVSQKTGLPLFAVSAKADLFAELSSLEAPLLSLKLQRKLI